MPMVRLTASAIVFRRTAGSEGRVESRTRFIRSESEVGAVQNASLVFLLFSALLCRWEAFAWRS